MEKRLLVIDNDIEMEDIFREVFANDGYQIFFYEDGDHVMELIEQHQPDLVVLDYNLDGKNGGELCKEIKTNQTTAHIPVIMFSAFPKFIYSPGNYGYDAFIEKPFDIDELVSTVEDTMNISR